MSARRRILSVEDVACNQQLVSLFLDPDHYAVDQVQSGLEALEALRNNDYDLILMDLRLPDLDGLEVVRRIREQEVGVSRQAILAVTADVLPARLAAAKAAGVDDHLAKPFTRAGLRDAVDRATSGRGSPTLENLNPVVADLAQNYGRSAVERLLRSLQEQLVRLDVGPLDAYALEHAAHALKGAAANLGFVRVAEACLELETACQSGVRTESPLEKASAACAGARREIALGLTAAA